MPLAFNKKHHDAIFSSVSIEQAREALQSLKSQLPAAFKNDSPYKNLDDLYFHALDMSSTRTIIVLKELFGIKHTSPEPKNSVCPSPFITLSCDFIVNFKLFLQQKFNELSIEFDEYPDEPSERSKGFAVSSAFMYLNMGLCVFDNKLNYTGK